MKVDTLVIGGGAAGLFCAAQAGQLGLKVVLIEHRTKLAEKVRISGGGRCNFTNVHTTPAQFLSQNPHFCTSALARYTPQDFIDLLKKHQIPFHEKHKGQLFCDRSAQDVIDMLVMLCQQAQVQLWTNTSFESVQALSSDEQQAQESSAMRYVVQTSRGPVWARHVVVATGGLSIPKIGATDVGYQLAKQFGLRMVPTQPALVPLLLDPPFPELSGVALPARVAVQVKQGKRLQRIEFDEDLLFTHKGLSGPAALQISSYWQMAKAAPAGTAQNAAQAATLLEIDLLPPKLEEGAWEPDGAQTSAPQSTSEHLGPQLGESTLTWLQRLRGSSKKQINTILAQVLPARLAEQWMQDWVSQTGQKQLSISDVADKSLKVLAQQLSDWHVAPSGTEGYAKAEVTLGGVDTRDLSSQTMQAKAQPGLFFIGEVVDVTGWLGGYNFQWAWASAFACATAMSQDAAGQGDVAV